MSFRNKLASMSATKSVYVKAYMLPENVAFKVEEIRRLTKDGVSSNVLYLTYKPGFVLQMWGDKSLQDSFDEKDVAEFNTALKSEDWYLVTYGKIGTNFPTKLLDKPQLNASGAAIYDHEKHVIDFDAKFPSPQSWELGKRRKTDF